MIKRLGPYFGFEEEMSALGLILGPLLLMLAIVLALKEPNDFNYDLIFVAVFGLFLTAKWRIRGCVAALLLLAFSSGLKHVWMSPHHLWQAGLEGSIGLSLLLSSLLFEKNAHWALSKQRELERNEKTILFLEEDLVQQKELMNKESTLAMEKLEGLRLQLEELQSEGFALQTLNDVLRKRTAKVIEEKEAALAKTVHFDQKEGLLLEEIHALKKEHKRLCNESALVLQNKELFQELNESRLKEAQTHLINETLVRLHATENQKVKEYETKLESEKGTQSIELLYKQLKVQFEEKNQILHQTREELFQSDTKLQTLQKKIEEKEPEKLPLFDEMNEEVDVMTEEMVALQQENQELQHLITSLMEQSIGKEKELLRR